MEAYHLSIHRVPGIVRLPDDKDFELVPLSPKIGARAILTLNRDLCFPHLRRLAAIQRIIRSAFTGERRANLSAAQEFAQLVSQARIDDGLYADSPLLIIEARGEVPDPDPSKINDLGEAGFGHQLFNDKGLVEAAQRTLEMAVAGLMLAMPIQDVREIETVGATSYLLESPKRRIVYSFGQDFIRATSSLATSVEARHLAEAAQYASALGDDLRLKTVARLFSQSVVATDNLTAFLTAWAGLEVFVSKIFKDTYEPVAFAELERASPPARKPFFTRLRDVMKDKYNIRDKFVLVASELEAADPDADIDVFKEVKDDRDAIHEMKIAPDALPTAAARKLLRKYLGLHLIRRLKG